MTSAAVKQVAGAEICFKLGMEFGETTADDRKVKSPVTCWMEANLFTCRSGTDKRKH